MNNTSKFVIEHNRLQSGHFLSSDEVTRRELYLSEHPTPVKVKKCMDGRVNVPAMTDDVIPMGVIAPFRNMGGRFRIGSPNYAHHVRNFHEYVVAGMKQGKWQGGLVIITYHYSAGSKDRGCKGFHNDTDAARSYTAKLRQDCDRVYGPHHQAVYAIQVGVETDNEAFVFHGDVPGSSLDIAQALDLSPEELRKKMRALYPDMKEGVFNDLMPFALGNQRHVRKVLEANKPPVELEHRESVIGIGRGFDWLHLINKALIVGPFSVDWTDEAVVAAKIVLDNFKAGRIPREDGAVLLVSAPFREHGVDAAIAEEKAREMARESYRAIAREVPELFGYGLDLLIGTLNRATMEMRWLEENPEEFLDEELKGNLKSVGVSLQPTELAA